jgi:carbamoylphosphate synthase large subunit
VVGTDVRPVEEISAFRKVPLAADPAFLDALIRVVADTGARLLIPTVSEELPIVAEARGFFRRRGCGLFISSAEASRTIHDKWLTAQALEASGVAVPRSFCGTSKAALLTRLSLPVLSRPRIGRGGRGVEIHRSEAGIPEPISRDRIFQEFLSGEEFDVNVFADVPGVAAVVVVLRKTALKSGLFGNAAAVERTQDREIARLVESAVQSLSLEGPLDVDVRKGASGSPAVLEINGRLGSNVRTAEEVLDRMTTLWREGR